MCGLLALLCASAAPAAPRSPLPPFPERALNTWRFDGQSSWGGPLSPPLALTGTQVTEGGSGYALRVGAAAGPVLNCFPLFQADGRPNLTLRSGTVRLWFAPDWSSVNAGGKGPGSFARLIEVGTPSAQATGWWSLYFDAEGNSIHFSAQAGGLSADCLKAPIAWVAGQWHQVTLIYCEKFSALFVDGELAAEGEGVSVCPEEKALAASGFCLGGDAQGGSLAEGQFDELTTLGHPAGTAEIAANYQWFGPALQLGPVTSAEMEARRAQSAALKTTGPLSPDGEEGGAGGGMQMMMSSPCGTNLCLGIEYVDQYAVLTLHNTKPGTNYQIFSRPDLYDQSLDSNHLNTALLEQELLGVEDQEYTQTVIPMNGRPYLFFRARTEDYHAPPFLHVSDVRRPVLPEPYVQVRGYSESALASLTWTVTSGTHSTNGRGYVLRQHYDTQQYKLTTNWWQCFDVPLWPGFNRIVVEAVDREGNTNSTTLHYAHLFAPNRVPPAAVVTFPAPGRTVAGAHFTLRGTVDNATASVRAEIIAGGATNRVAGVVERNGNFWIDNLPLDAGSNDVALIVADAGGVSATNRFNVPGSAAEFTITSPGTGNFLHDPAVTLAGAVPSGYSVTVNGVAASVNGGYWTAQDVPINRGGVALFHAEATGGGQTLVTELALDKPTREFMESVHRVESQKQDWSPCDWTGGGDDTINKTNTLRWAFLVGGSWIFSLAQEVSCGTFNFSSSTQSWAALERVTFYSPGQPCAHCLPGPYVEHGYLDGTLTVATENNGNQQGHYRIRSEGQMHVQSGGRSIARRQETVRFDGSGTEYLALTDPVNVTDPNVHIWNWTFDPNYATSSNLVTIPPTSITVLGRPLHTNGVLYESVPKGAEVDCTPHAPGDLRQIYLVASDATPRLWMDWDNDSQSSNPENDETERWLKWLPPSVENPGKVLFAGTGDSNGDGAPDFADGYGGFGGQSNGAAGPLVPLVIDIPANVDTNRLRLTLAYDLSSPGGVTLSGGVDGGFIFTPGSGALRLWTRNGNEARTNAFVESGGNLISPSTSYRITDLPFSDAGNAFRITLYVESVRPSAVIGDQIVTLYADADGPEGGSREGMVDQAFFTTLDAVLVEVDSGGNTTPTTKLEASHPSPVITVSACSVGNVQASADYQAIVGTLSLAGAVQSAVCDLSPGTNGAIDEVFVYVNSYDTPLIVLPAVVTKSTNAGSLFQPFPYAGAFSTNLAGVELELGVNLIRVTAVDKVMGITGYAEYTVEVSGQKTNQLLESYADAGVGLDFGGITALSQLTGSTPVGFGFTNAATSASYNGTLHKVSDSPLVLSNASAWVNIPDPAALDAALGAGGAARFDASVSVPALAPLHIGFTLERATNSGPFTFQFVEMQLTANGPLNGTAPDSVTVQLRKGGGSWQTATLTNSTGATNLFGNATGSYAVELAYTPSLVTTQADELIVVVTNATLGLAGDVLGLIETATNSKVFASDPGLLHLDDDWRDWTFGGGNGTALAASSGGVLKPYALQYAGPPALLDAITNISLLDEQGQPVGSRQVVKKDGKHFLRSVATTTGNLALFFANPVGQIQQRHARVHNANEAGQFLMGFGAGFYEGGVSLVEGVGKLAILSFKFSHLGLRYEMATGQNYRQELNTLVTTYKAIKPLMDFWVEWRTRQLNDVFTSPNATEAALRAVSEDAALIAAFAKELIIYLEQLDANSTPYDRGKLQGRVAFEVVSLLIAEIKLAQAGQITKITKLGTLTKLAARPGIQVDAKAAAAVESATQFVSNPAAHGSSTLAQLTEAAARAKAIQGPGQGAVHGTKVHTLFKLQVERIGRGDLIPERSYRLGVVVPNGTKGSVRLDVIEGSLTAPQAIYDLKTGSAALKAKRIAQIREHLPQGFHDIPILEIR